jgi:hypothetical protein
MDSKETAQEELKKAESNKPNPFEIWVDSKKYITSKEELDNALVSILSSGSFTKTFSLFGGKLELTYTSISEDQRMKSYDFTRKYIEANKEAISKVMIDSYTARVNVASQLVRIKTNGHTTNLAQGSLDEKIQLLLETPEDVLRVYSQYLIVFAQIVNMAFSDDEALKN